MSVPMNVTYVAKFKRCCDGAGLDSISALVVAHTSFSSKCPEKGTVGVKKSLRRLARSSRFPICERFLSAWSQSLQGCIHESTCSNSLYVHA